MEGADKTKTVDVIFLFAGKKFSSNFVISWSNTLIYLHNKQISFLYAFGYTPIVSQVRNALLNFNFSYTKLRSINAYNSSVFQNTAKSKKVIFIDSDMVWEVEAIDKLIHAEQPVIMAPYVLSDKSRVSVRLGDKEWANVETIKNYNQTTKCLGGGLGFTACDFEVLTKLQFPWFAIPEHINGEVSEPYGEDVYFFDNVRKAGYDIYFDPSIKVGHEKSEIWTIG